MLSHYGVQWEIKSELSDTTSKFQEIKSELWEMKSNCEIKSQFDSERSSHSP